MKYGYFDDENREYVITSPDTPAPWANYLGSPKYGALISGNAGGYSFVRSGANGRILRYVFNDADRPGRYIYIRDNETADYWSASWQPVGKSLDEYRSECRHGTGYTKILAEYAGIRSEVLYYVPLDKEYEVWRVRVENCSDTSRDLSVTGYAEFTNHGNYEQDQVNLQYSLFISRTLFEGNRIRNLIHGNLEGVDMDREKGDGLEERFFGLTGADVSSCCGDREAFLGRYHSYGDPEGVARGDLGGEMNYNGHSCGALMTKITLAPGESRTFAFLVGMKDKAESAELLAQYSDVIGATARDMEELLGFWHGNLSRFKVTTPSPEFSSARKRNSVSSSVRGGRASVSTAEASASRAYRARYRSDANPRRIPQLSLSAAAEATANAAFFQSSSVKP